MQNDNGSFHKIQATLASHLPQFLTYWEKIVCLISCEWILTNLRRPNGGDVILLRSLLITIFVSILGWLLPIGWNVTTAWFGTIFAAVYVALYARFSQQWQYIANLYNQIKAAEVRASGEKSTDDAKKQIGMWKAGFIEDAETLHLATKPMVASIIRAWGNEELVRQSYIAHTIGGENRFSNLMRNIEAACKRHSEDLDKLRTTIC